MFSSFGQMPGSDLPTLRWNPSLGINRFSKRLAARDRCPLFPQKRTFVLQNGMSSMGRKRTFMPYCNEISVRFFGGDTPEHDLAVKPVLPNPVTDLSFQFRGKTPPDRPSCLENIRTSIHNGQKVFRVGDL